MINSKATTKKKATPILAARTKSISAHQYPRAEGVDALPRIPLPRRIIEIEIYKTAQPEAESTPVHLSFLGSPYPSLCLSLSLQKTSSRFPSKKKTSSDIVSGTFKGFALLRQQALASRADGRPAYLAGYGLVPPAQVRGASVSAFFR